MIPTVTLYKNGEPCIVNECDAHEWEARGYTRKAAKQSEPEAIEEPAKRRGRPPKAKE